MDVTKYLGDKNKLADDKEGTKAGFKLSNADGKWATVENMKITGWVDSEDKATQVETAADGTFKFIGLDDGTYVLHETKTPAGYNTMAPLTLQIIAGTVQCQDYMEIEAHDAPDEVLTSLKLKVGDANPVDGTTSDGIVKTEIINQKGSSLPSTGGIGTTMFYVGGGVLVAGAGVLLITKKRAKKDAE